MSIARPGEWVTVCVCVCLSFSHSRLSPHRSGAVCLSVPVSQKWAVPLNLCAETGRRREIPVRLVAMLAAVNTYDTGVLFRTAGSAGFFRAVFHRVSVCVLV